MNKNSELYAPKEYYELSPAERKRLLNQCGPTGSLNTYIPNHLIGTNISQSCDIHDFMFFKAKNKKEAEVADKIFLKNINVQIEKSSSWQILNPLRKFFAQIYFYATRVYSTIKK